MVANNPIKQDVSAKLGELPEENLTIAAKEKELIEKALKKYDGNRKYAAIGLGISERTLYRKIKQYELICTES